MLRCFNREVDNLSQWQSEFRGQIRALRQWLKCMEMRLPPLDPKVSWIFCLPYCCCLFASLAFQFSSHTHVRDVLTGRKPLIQRESVDWRNPSVMSFLSLSQWHTHFHFFTHSHCVCPLTTAAGKTGTILYLWGPFITLENKATTLNEHNNIYQASCSVCPSWDVHNSSIKSTFLMVQASCNFPPWSTATYFPLIQSHK